MTQSPTDVLTTAYQTAKKSSVSSQLQELPDDCVKDLRIIVEHAESLKGVLGVTLTSIVYKVLHPSQDIRFHQEHMQEGYSGRGFDTRYITPFLKDNFSHFAMAESSWLTRSLEQPHPYNFDYPGKIRNQQVKTAFLNTLNRLQTHSQLASHMLVGLLALMVEVSADETSLMSTLEISDDLTITRIVQAVQQHIYYPYRKGATGTARLPVLIIYAVYRLLMPDVKRYTGKTLTPLEAHTSPDSRSKSLGDIEIKNSDGSVFEAIEIKHLKPISEDMLRVAYRKYKDTHLNRYYILTTNEPNYADQEALMQKLEAYNRLHPCQIVTNGVFPSLKYYLRLVSQPQTFVEEYTKWLEFEYQRASGIKKQHLQVWQEIRQTILNIK